MTEMIYNNIALFHAQEGTIREVKEETGMNFVPETLISVEMASGFWYRFTFTGKATGENCT